MSRNASCELSASLHIRQAQTVDASNIIKGINEICAEGGAFYTTHFVPSEQWQAVFYRPETVPDHLLLIAEWKGHFVGAVNLFPGELHTLHRHVAILGLFVLNPYRNSGIGKQLLVHALKWARKTNLEKITLVVFATNRWAIQLYKEFGFIQEGCLKRQLKSDSDYIDLLQLSLFL